MKRKQVAILLAALLSISVAALGGCDNGNTGGNPSGSGSGGSPTDAVAAYYSSLTATAGTELLGELHDLITATHTRYTSYNDSKTYGPTTDPALDGGSGVVEFYTHETVTTWTHDGGSPGEWNREHVWAQALSGGLWGKEGGGADLHHLRPSEVKMNGQRGDNKFGTVTGGGEVWSKTTGGENSKLGGHRAGGVFEPLDIAKGDVARILFYVYTHYNTYSNVYGTTNGNTNGQTASYFGTLHFTNIVSASSEEEAIELLLQWNELDPVDEIETKRNAEVYKIQKNRNPFIDHPEFADAIWGESAIA